jgi:hypothetical protein
VGDRRLTPPDMRLHPSIFIVLDDLARPGLSIRTWRLFCLYTSPSPPIAKKKTRISTISLDTETATSAGETIRRHELIRTSSKKFNNLSPSSSESPYSTAVARRRQGTVSPHVCQSGFFVFRSDRRGFQYLSWRTKRCTIR